MMRTTLILTLLVLATRFAGAQESCFSRANTYYERVYCQVVEEGKGSDLPPFYQFRNNDKATQALLLRRPAAALGIRIDEPVPEAREEEQPTLAQARQTDKSQDEQATGEHSLAGCGIRTTRITCGYSRYELIGNLSNKNIDKRMLDARNKMELPEFDGDARDTDAVHAYLVDAYRQYIRKMLLIGLGGATLSFTKFAYLFDDLDGQGVSFSERFEVMYSFLKKDKLIIEVQPMTTDDPGLTLADCELLIKEVIVCERRGRNYLYLRNED